MKIEMKILYIAHEVNLGGATKCLLSLLDEMIERGHQVSVVYTKYDGDLEGELDKRGIKKYKIKFYPWKYNPHYCKSLEAKVKKIITYINAVLFSYRIKNQKYDIIHTNSSTIDFGLIISKKINAKHLFQFREFGLEDQGIVFRDGIERATRIIDKRSDMIVFVSKSLMSKYSQYFNDKCMVIYDGITDEYCNYKRNHNNETIKFIISGSIVENKGQREVVEAVRKLVESGKNGFTVKIIGKGDERFTQELMQYVSDNRLTDYVVFEGYSTDMISKRKESDVELVCSASEAFGRVTVESMMSCNPVIASDMGANVELIEDGWNGFIYKKGNTSELAEKMLEFIDDHRKIDLMGQNAYEYATKMFTSQKNADRFEEVYHLMIKQ